MDNIEWAQTCTPDQLIEEIIDRLTTGSYHDGAVILKTLEKRFPEEVLTNPLFLFISTPTAMHAVGTRPPEQVEAGKAALRKAWAKVKP